MRCTSPRTVGFKPDGKTISWSQKHRSKEYATFQLPCGKCISCRLAYARDCAVRCVHEAQMHPENAFITLTYDQEHLESKKLIYRDFQLFMKKLRKLSNNPIGVFVTGEYGTEEKRPTWAEIPKLKDGTPIPNRPHWHAIIFGWNPRDGEEIRTNSNGDKIYSSETLSKLWGKGSCEFGSVTLKSAGYVARYAAKKLEHGHDGTHDLDPVHKRSSKHAIGKKWLEKFWPDIFNYGELRLNGITMPIPRYYEKWLKKHHPERWNTYVTEIKLKKTQSAEAKAEQQFKLYRATEDARRLTNPFCRPSVTQAQARATILKQKFEERLQKNLKL